MKLLVLHGTNLNLFGRREPHIYGTTTLAEIDSRLHALAGELGAELEIFQSNQEVLDGLQEVAGGTAVFATTPAADLQASLVEVEESLQAQG